MSEMKPCPFCGSDELSHGSARPGFNEESSGIVQCHDDNCGACMLGYDEDEAIVKWNTRADARRLGMEEALVKCRDRFREYERSHQYRADEAMADVKEAGGPAHARADYERGLERQTKATRNREMAEMCEAAIRDAAKEAGA